jgi:small subunit ribosomal protein S6
MAEVQTAGRKAREYETIYVLRPDVSRETQERIASRIEEVVGREGGKLTAVENWGRRQLAYTVAKCRRGVYIYSKYVGGGPLVNEIERNLRMQDDVLKYQTVLVNEAVDMSGVEVNPDNLKFEAVEPPGEDEPEETIEQVLGLVDSPERERPHSHDPEEDFEGGMDAEEES